MDRFDRLLWLMDYMAQGTSLPSHLVLTDWFISQEADNWLEVWLEEGAIRPLHQPLRVAIWQRASCVLRYLYLTTLSEKPFGEGLSEQEILLGLLVDRWPAVLDAVRPQPRFEESMAA